MALKLDETLAVAESRNSMFSSSLAIESQSMALELELDDAYVFMVYVEAIVRAASVVVPCACERACETRYSTQTAQSIVRHANQPSKILNKNPH